MPILPDCEHCLMSQLGRLVKERGTTVVPLEVLEMITRDIQVGELHPAGGGGRFKVPCQPDGYCVVKWGGNDLDRAANSKGNEPVDVAETWFALYYGTGELAHDMCKAKVIGPSRVSFTDMQKRLP